jgi:hypothetical protein
LRGQLSCISLYLESGLCCLWPYKHGFTESMFLLVYGLLCVNGKHWLSAVPCFICHNINYGKYAPIVVGLALKQVVRFVPVL